MRSQIIFILSNSPGIKTMQIPKQRGLRRSFSTSGFHIYRDGECHTHHLWLNDIFAISIPPWIGSCCVS